MRHLSCTAFLLLLSHVCAPLGASAFADDPAHEARSDPSGLILTWQRDPTTTMTIDWHRWPDAGGVAPTELGTATLRFRATGTDEWRFATGETLPFPFCTRTIHRVELTGLAPASEYEFRLGAEDLGADARTYRFRTMPTTLDAPLRFAAGGDIRHRRSWMDAMNRRAMAFDPSFIVWGGDLAYADGRAENIGRWDEFLASMLETLVHDDGRVVPVVVGVGNHEVTRHTCLDRESFDGSDEWRNRRAPFFYGLFAFPGHPGYGVLDFGNWLSLVLLDTDHTSLVAGAQTEWLEEILSERVDRMRHVIPIQHVPAYPSVRAFEGETPLGGRISMRIREHFCPLFDRFGVRLVLENHDHAYKRTPPIRGNEVHPDGIVYIGDGAWGVGTRAPRDPADAWWLEQTAEVRHALVVTLDREAIDVVAVDADGEVLDEVRIPRVAPIDPDRKGDRSERPRRP